MDEETEWEHQEELSEVEKILKLNIEVLRNSPELKQELAKIQPKTQTTGHLHESCAACCRKREFITIIQTMGIISDMRYGTNCGSWAISCAFRVPATRLLTLNLLEAASELLRWLYDEALGDQRVGIAQPSWYSKESMEEDRHE